MPASMLVACVACGRRNRLRPEHLADAGRCGACGADLPPLGVPVAIDDAVALAGVLAASALPVLVDFWAPWCGPCRSVAPEIARVAARRAGRLLVVKTNTDVDPAVGPLHRIMAVPTMILFVEGRELSRQSGALPAPQIEAWMDDARQAVP